MGGCGDPCDNLTVTLLYSSNIYGTSRFTKQFCIPYLTYPDDKPVNRSYHYRDEKTETPKVTRLVQSHIVSVG